MKAQFEQQTPGFAALVLTLEGIEPGDGPCTLAVQRSTDQCFMGQGGMGAWTMKEEYLSLPCQRQGDTLRCELGPEYVDHLEPGNYRVSLRVAGGDTGQARMKIDSVQTQALAGSGAMQTQAGREAPTAPPSPVVPAAPVTEPAPEPAPEPEPAVQPEPANEAPLVMEAQPPAQARGKLPMLLLALVAVLCLAGAGWYLYQQHAAGVQAEQERLAAAEAAQKAEEERLAAEAAARAEQERRAAEEAEAARKAEAERLAAEEAAREAARLAAHRADARGRARTFFAGADRTPQGAFELTQDVDTTTSEQQDAVFRLLYFAANGGHQPAFVPYAACLDPTTEKWGTLEKDPPEAWAYYKKAGTDEGTAAANRVLEWVKQQPPTNAKAREWLQLMRQ